MKDEGQPGRPRDRAPIDRSPPGLQRLHPRLIDLSLDRLRRLLARLGHPEQRLPPVIHVAGTNGKGSTCAFVRAMAEAAGLRVHVYTSPHLVRFNERIRVAGQMVEDDASDRRDGTDRTDQRQRADHRVRGDHRRRLRSVRRDPADLCVLEVGLGGRGDATNVIDTPAACAITSISLDHREMLGPSVGDDRGGKSRDHEARRAGGDRRAAAEVLPCCWGAPSAPGALVLRRGRDWDIESDRRRPGLQRRVRDSDLPLPVVARRCTRHDNAGIALAALRAAGLAARSGRHRPRGMACPAAAPATAGWRRLLPPALGTLARRRPQPRRRHGPGGPPATAGPIGRCIWWWE